MKVLTKHISPKIILNTLLGFAIIGMVFILLSVNRLNSILSTDLGFRKDSVISIKTNESSLVLPDSMIFTSDMPGFYTHNTVHVKSEFSKDEIEVGQQYVSAGYFDFFKYEKVSEKPKLFLDHGDALLVYVNESAVNALGIKNVEDATGTILTNEFNQHLVICGVVKDYEALNVLKASQPRIFQLSSDHLAYAFAPYDAATKDLKQVNEIKKSGIISFQQRIEDYYRLGEDIVYSAFLFINIFILLICLGQIGIKYTCPKERDLIKLFGLGIHVLTLVISKKYIYLIAIIGLVVWPLAFLIQKFWLELYTYRINFGLVDLFIILSMALLTVYLVCCPKIKPNNRLKGKTIQHNSI